MVRFLLVFLYERTFAISPPQMNTLKNSYSFTKRRSGGSRKSDGQKAIFFRASASISTSAERRRNLQIRHRIRAASLGEVREIQADSYEKKRCASAFTKRSRGCVFFHRQAVRRTALKTNDPSSKKTSSPPSPRGKLRQAALFLYVARACCRSCSTRPAPATRRTVAEARKRELVPCLHAPRRPARRPGKAAAVVVWSLQRCGQRQAWVVRNRCQANVRASQRRTCRRRRRRRQLRLERSYRALRAASNSSSTTLARSPCRYPCARPSFHVPCPPPTSRNSMPRLGSDVRRRENRSVRLLSTFRARIVRGASARDLARPRRGTHRRSHLKRSALVGKASAHDRAEIGRFLMGGMAAWMKMH